MTEKESLVKGTEAQNLEDENKLRNDIKAMNSIMNDFQGADKDIHITVFLQYKHEVPNGEIIDEKKLNELKSFMRRIMNELPNAEKDIHITVFLSHRREVLVKKKSNNFGSEKQNMNSTSSVNYESLFNSLSFKLAKDGKNEYATIDRKDEKTFPDRYENENYIYYKGKRRDAIIRVQKKNQNNKSS